MEKNSLRVETLPIFPNTYPNLSWIPLPDVWKWFIWDNLAFDQVNHNLYNVHIIYIDTWFEKKIFSFSKKEKNHEIDPFTHNRNISLFRFRDKVRGKVDRVSLASSLSGLHFRIVHISVEGVQFWSSLEYGGGSPVTRFWPTQIPLRIQWSGNRIPLLVHL